MFNVCPCCGQYAVEKDIDPVGPFAICPFCGHKHLFRRLPLFVITGASAAGKSTVCLALPWMLPECVSIECDVLWGPAFDDPAQGYRGFRNTWLRLAKNIGQSGRSIVLCGSAIPEQYESCPERRYFAAIHYLALVCEDSELARRLRSRPGWRGSSASDVVQRMLAFNRWLVDNAILTRPPMTLLDTTGQNAEQTVTSVLAWVRSLLR